jgi:uncharacterized protein (DUF1778 family)
LRLDAQSAQCLAQAAALRQISVSEYVRTVAVPQARWEIAAAHQEFLVLTPGEQLAFWKALNQQRRPTAAQRRLAAVMRGESYATDALTCEHD